MTANQISYALAEETKRHNIENEDIERERNRISQLKADNDKAYQEASTNIQKQYNDKYLELQEAQGNKRLEIEQELNSIKQQQIALDDWYKTESVVVDKSNAETKRREQAATERYQQKLAEIGFDKNQIDWYNAFVNEKWTDYQKHSIDLTHAEQSLSMQIARERNQQQYETQIMSLNQELIKTQLEAQKTLLQAELTKRGQNTQLLNGLIMSTDSLIKTLSGRIK